MAIGAYTMAILVVKEGWSTWLAAPLGVAAAARRRVCSSASPSLRLRADYFAIVTIAFSEIVRYVATNEDVTHRRLTGDDRAWHGRDGRPVQRPVGALPGPRAGRGSASRSKDATMLVIVWARRGRPAHARRGLRCGRRGDACCARSARTRTRRRRSARTCFSYKLQALAIGSALAGIAGLLLRVAVLVLQPGRLRAAADVLRVDDRDPRRRSAASGPCRSARSSSASSSPARASSTSRRSRTSHRRRPRLPAADRDRPDHHRARDRAAAGDARQA